jgi:superfamily I DNA/RNA helicase
LSPQLLAPESRVQSDRRVENVEEIVNAVASYTEREPRPSLTGFLEKVGITRARLTPER